MLNAVEYFGAEHLLPYQNYTPKLHLNGATYYFLDSILEHNKECIDFKFFLCSHFSG